jgi:hypothetical protein
MLLASSRHRLLLLLVSLISILVSAHEIVAIPVADYRKNIEQVVGALDTFGSKDESETPSQQQARNAATLKSIQSLIPQNLNVESNGTSYAVDNEWFHQELHELERASESEQPKILSRIQDRLRALQDRLLELEKGQVGGENKAGEKQRLREILAHPDYQSKAESPGLLARWWQKFLRWFASLFGRPDAIQPSSARRITQVAQYFVIGLALAVIAYALRMFVPALRRDRGVKKSAKREARIVLGERLEPEQSASNILSDAEALARRGDIRGAIRKAYIALLVELGERKILSLAQHKTNRDYLSSLRDRRLLYGKMISLTDAFERHWYGLAAAGETDWSEFRARYSDALKE